MFQIVYPAIYAEYGKDYWAMRGFLSDVHVVVDGVSHAVYFMDVFCLTQLMEMQKENGQNYFADRSLVILDELTEQNMERAVAGLVKQGYFTKDT